MSELTGFTALERVFKVGSLVAARLAPLVFVAPWFVLPVFPWLIRVTLLLGLTAALTPGALQTAPEVAGDLTTLSILAVREATIGVIFAFAASLPFYALAWAGSVSDYRRGAAAQSRDLNESTSPLADFYLLATIFLFFSIGGHRLVIYSLADSLATLPVGGSSQLTGLAPVIWSCINLFAHAFSFAVVIAAPVLTVAVTTEIGLGVLGRISPVISASLRDAPLQALLALGVSFCCLAYSLSLLPNGFGRAIEQARELIRQLTP